MNEPIPYYTPPPSAVPLPRKSRDFSLAIIVVCVLAAHMSLIWLSSISAKEKPVLPPRERLVVKTIPLKPRPLPQPRVEPVVAIPEPVAAVPEPIPEPVPAPPEPPKPQPQLKEEPPPPPPPPPPKPKSKPQPPKPKPAPKKKAEPKKEQKKEPKKEKAPQPPPKPKPAPAAPPKPKPDPVAEARKARQKELLSKAKESLSKAVTSRETAPTQVSDTAMGNIPKPIGSLQIEALPTGELVTLSTREISYRDELASRLKLGLRLPEYGEVKIKLTLERSGKVAQVQIVSSKSVKNKEYIEKTLPTLTFPGFGDNFKGSTQYTFAITLNNE